MGDMMTGSQPTAQGQATALPAQGTNVIPSSIAVGGYNAAPSMVSTTVPAQGPRNQSAFGAAISDPNNMALMGRIGSAYLQGSNQLIPIGHGYVTRAGSSAGIAAALQAGSDEAFKQAVNARKLEEELEREERADEVYGRRSDRKEAHDKEMVRLRGQTQLDYLEAQDKDVSQRAKEAAAARKELSDFEFRQRTQAAETKMSFDAKQAELDRTNALRIEALRSGDKERARELREKQDRQKIELEAIRYDVPTTESASDDPFLKSLADSVPANFRDVAQAGLKLAVRPRTNFAIQQAIAGRQRDSAKAKISQEAAEKAAKINAENAERDAKLAEEAVELGLVKPDSSLRQQIAAKKFEDKQAAKSGKTGKEASDDEVIGSDAYSEVRRAILTKQREHGINTKSGGTAPAELDSAQREFVIAKIKSNNLPLHATGGGFDDEHLNAFDDIADDLIGEDTTVQPKETPSLKAEIDAAGKENTNQSRAKKVGKFLLEAILP